MISNWIKIPDGNNGSIYINMGNISWVEVDDDGIVHIHFTGGSQNLSSKNNDNAKKFIEDLENRINTQGQISENFSSLVLGEKTKKQEITPPQQPMPIFTSTTPYTGQYNNATIPNMPMIPPIHPSIANIIAALNMKPATYASTTYASTQQNPLDAICEALKYRFQHIDIDVLRTMGMNLIQLYAEDLPASAITPHLTQSNETGTEDSYLIDNFVTSSKEMKIPENLAGFDKQAKSIINEQFNVVDPSRQTEIITEAKKAFINTNVDLLATMYPIFDDAMGRSWLYAILFELFFPSNNSNDLPDNTALHPILLEITNFALSIENNYVKQKIEIIVGNIPMTLHLDSSGQYTTCETSEAEHFLSIEIFDDGSSSLMPLITNITDFYKECSMTYIANISKISDRFVYPVFIQKEPGQTKPNITLANLGMTYNQHNPITNVSKAYRVVGCDNKTHWERMM